MRYHLCVDVEGAIEALKDGQNAFNVSPEKALEEMEALKAKGQKYFVGDNCDNQTSEGRCAGHEDIYKPVPVEAAKQIAERFDKSIVIISTWDPKFGLLHTTTYGVSTDEKEWAAKGGEITAKALGADMEKMQMFEDFRKAKK